MGDAKGSTPPRETDVPKDATASKPASSSKADCDLKEAQKVVRQKDCYVNTLPSDNEYLNDVSLGYSKENNLKQPLKCFKTEDYHQLHNLIDMQSEKLFTIVEKNGAIQRKKVMAAIAAKKGVIKVTSNNVRSFLCHQKSVEKAKQNKLAKMRRKQVDKSKEPDSTKVDADKPEEMESTQVHKPEEMESTQVDKPEETVSKQIDELEKTESMEVDNPEEMKMVSTETSTPIPFELLEGEARFGAEKLKMLRMVLDAGWRREIVLRSARSSGTKIGEVYYYSPEGQKFKTAKHLASYLLEINSPFTIANFSFVMLRISSENPEQEIVRTAYVPKSPLPLAAVQKEDDSNDKASLSQPPSPATVQESRHMKERTSVQPPKRYVDEVMLLPRRSQAQEEKYWSENADNGLLLMGLVPPKWLNEVDEPSRKLDGQSNNQGWKIRKQKPATPCSIGCPKMIGMVPNLQCARCRCLFHMKCVGLRATIAVKNYLCLNCIEEEEQKTGRGPTFQLKPMTIKKPAGKPLPDLTPISFVETGPVTMAAKASPSRSVSMEMTSGNEADTKQPPPQKIKRGRGRPPKYRPQQQSALSSLISRNVLATAQMPRKRGPRPRPRSPGLADTSLRWMSAPLGKQPVPKYMNPNAFKKVQEGPYWRNLGDECSQLTPLSDRNEHEKPTLNKLCPQNVCSFGGRKFIVLPKRRSVDISDSEAVAGKVGLSEGIAEDESLGQVNNSSCADVDVPMDESTDSVGGSGSEQVNNCNGGDANDDDKKMDFGWLF